MNYKEAVDYISSIPRFTKKNAQSHTKDFLKRLGSPEVGRKVIHVAGTNGKGSICAYLQAMLQTEGKTTGLFISPHLVTMNERIVINGRMIDDSFFLEVFEEVLAVVRKMESEGENHPSFFEFLFGMGMLAFAKVDVEYLILETGLGGRLDATNAIDHPVATVIATIGLDHTQWLGETEEDIAVEKAGIIKDETPLFYLEGKESINEIIEKHALWHHAPCKKIAKCAYEFQESDSKHIAFSCVSAYYEDTIWELHNRAKYQADNAMIALEVMRYLCGEDKHLAQWRSSLSNVLWEGRMEEILPDFYIDGAHNISAVEAFTDTMPENPKGSMILFSAMEDKDYEQMIAHLCGHVTHTEFVVTTIEDARGSSVSALKAQFEKYTTAPVLVMESLQDAMDYLLANQNGRDIFCLGSLYLTGMIKDLLRRDRR